MLLHDAILASAHHLCAFGLLALIAGELVLLRTWPAGGANWLKRLGALDAMYGATAGLLLVIGVARVVLSPKTTAFYLHNPFFWAKMAAFLVVGLMSIPPTLAFIRWRKAGGPTEAAVAGVRRWLLAELALFTLIPVLAAFMARWAG